MIMMMEIEEAASSKISSDDAYCRSSYGLGRRNATFGTSRLHLRFQPGLQLVERQSAMGYAVLLRLVHLRISLTFVLKDRVPT